MASPGAITSSQAMDEARRRHLAGDLAGARTLYRQLLEVEPHQPDVLTMLASIAYQSAEDAAGADMVEQAIAEYRRRLSINPSHDAMRAALANLLLARQRPAVAEAVIGKAALGLRPMRSTRDEFEQRRRHGRDAGLPPILINALPKSASESIWNKLANGLNIAQAHVSIGLFPDCLAVPHRVRELGQGGVSAKEHMPASRHNLRSLAEAGVDRVVVHIREPRQSLLSWAHFLESDVSKRLLAPIWRKTTPRAEFFRRPFATQIDWHIDHYLPIVIRFIEEWVAARDDDSSGVSVRFLTFEEFRTDPSGYFEAFLDFYGIDQGLFAPDAEAEVVHLRKGALDEWRDCFTPEQADRAWGLIPAALADEFCWRS